MQTLSPGWTVDLRPRPNCMTQALGHRYWFWNKQVKFTAYKYSFPPSHFYGKIILPHSVDFGCSHGTFLANGIYLCGYSWASVISRPRKNLRGTWSIPELSQPWGVRGPNQDQQGHSAKPNLDQLTSANPQTHDCCTSQRLCVSVCVCTQHYSGHS